MKLWNGNYDDPILAVQAREVAANWNNTNQLSNALDAAALRIETLEAMHCPICGCRLMTHGKTCPPDYHVRDRDAEESAIRKDTEISELTFPVKRATYFINRV